MLHYIALYYRMDVDQSARTNAQEYFGVKDPDYYEFEGEFDQREFRKD